MAAHPSGDLVAQMDEAGVDKATLVQAYYVYEYDNRYTIDAALAHPDRFTAVVVLDPMDPGVARRAEPHGGGAGRYGHPLHARPAGGELRSASRRRFRCGAHPVAEESRRGRTTASAEISKIAAAMERYPDVKVSFEHAWGHKVGAPPDYEVLKPLFELSRTIPNVYIKTAINNVAAAREGGGTPRELYQKLVDVFGAKRIMWSSNYPAHPKIGGVKEQLDESKKELAFLSRGRPGVDTRQDGARVLSRAREVTKKKLKGKTWHALPLIEADGDLNPEQKRVVEALLGRRGGRIPGPFRLSLHCPELTEVWHPLGETLRLKSSFPLRLSEFAIIITARAWDCDYVFQAHKKITRENGLAQAVVTRSRKASGRSSRRKTKRRCMTTAPSSSTSTRSATKPTIARRRSSVCRASSS